jgi:anti-anti-sigma factor
MNRMSHDADAPRTGIDLTDTVASRRSGWATILDSQEHVEVLHVFGDLDLSVAMAFESDIMNAIVAGKKLVIELSECRYADSAIISLLVDTREVLGDAFSLVVAPESNLDRLFAITELHERLGIVPSLDLVPRL